MKRLDPVVFSLSMSAIAAAQSSPDDGEQSAHAYWPQSADDPDRLIHEAPAVRAPHDGGASMPVPIGLGHDGLFQEGWNVQVLLPLTTAEMEAAEQRSAMRNAGITPGPRRVGIGRAIDPAWNLSDGAVIEKLLDDGRILRTFAVRSQGAKAIRAHFSDFDVGTGEMIVYSGAGAEFVARGPYTRRGPRDTGELWSATVPGEWLLIEIVTRAEEPAPLVRIDRIVHFDHDPYGGDPEGGPVACHLDVTCFGDPPVNPVARDATARILYEGEDGDTHSCSGTLLNDLDDETWMPYFLTAYHCLHTQTEVNSLEVLWLYQTDSCNGTVPPIDTLPVSNGGTLLETNSTNFGNDMTFIRLDGPVPPGVGLAGWMTATSIDGVGIHHPAGSWKRATFFSPVGACPVSCVCFGGGLYYDFYDIDSTGGMTEGGSSGSGIFTAAGNLAGQLYGSCCGNPLGCTGGCANPNEVTYVYGEFETTHPIIRRWLEIGGTINVFGGYSGAELGTPTQPFNTVNEANAFAWNGSRIRILAGAYEENVVFSKSLTILAYGGAVRIGQ